MSLLEYDTPALQSDAAPSALAQEHPGASSQKDPASPEPGGFLIEAAVSHEQLSLNIDSQVSSQDVDSTLAMMLDLGGRDDEETDPTESIRREVSGTRASDQEFSLEHPEGEAVEELERPGEPAMVAEEAVSTEQGDEFLRQDQQRRDEKSDSLPNIFEDAPTDAATNEVQPASPMLNPDQHVSHADEAPTKHAEMEHPEVVDQPTDTPEADNHTAHGKAPMEPDDTFTDFLRRAQVELNVENNDVACTETPAHIPNEVDMPPREKSVGKSMGAAEVVAGAYVHISGIQSTPQLNGQTCKVLRAGDNGRWIVSTDIGEKSVRLENLTVRTLDQEVTTCKDALPGSVPSRGNTREVTPQPAQARAEVGNGCPSFMEVVQGLELPSKSAREIDADRGTDSHATPERRRRVDPRILLQQAIEVVVDVIYTKYFPKKLPEVAKIVQRHAHGGITGLMVLLHEIIETFVMRKFPEAPKEPRKLAEQAAAYKEMISELEESLPAHYRTVKQDWPHRFEPSCGDLLLDFQLNFARLLEPCAAAPGRSPDSTSFAQQAPRALEISDDVARRLDHHVQSLLGKQPETPMHTSSSSSSSWRPKRAMSVEDEQAKANCQAFVCGKLTEAYKRQRLSKEDFSADSGARVDSRSDRDHRVSTSVLDGVVFGEPEKQEAAERDVQPGILFDRKQALGTKRKMQAQTHWQGQAEPQPQLKSTAGPQPPPQARSPAPRRRMSTASFLASFE